MNLRGVVLAAGAGIALAVVASNPAFADSLPSAPPGLENRAVAIGNLMQAWQSRILATNMPVDDAKNWARRNLAKFSRLSRDRLALAQRASTLAELELVLLDAPIPEGTHLDVLLASKPGDIAMSGSIAKSSPATSPSSYANMVFTALNPCRILDTRPSQGGFGAWTAGSTNTIKIGPYGTGYQTGPGSQGGSATSCGLDTLAGPGKIAVIMAAVSTVSQAGAGYLTFFPQGSPNPGLTSVSQWYQPGYVQTSFVLIPTDLTSLVAASGFTSATTDLIIDVVGYFTDLVGAIVTADLANGAVTAIKMASNGCTTGQVLQYNGVTWVCALAGISATAKISGFIGNPPPVDPANFLFMGPTVLVATLSGQHLTGAAMVPLGATATVQIQLDLCYQPSGGGAIINFAGGNYSYIQVGTVRVGHSVAGTTVPGPGTWNVGACVRGGSASINNNDYVNGWIQVTN